MLHRNLPKAESNWKDAAHSAKKYAEKEKGLAPKGHMQRDSTTFSAGNGIDDFEMDDDQAAVSLHG